MSTYVWNSENPYVYNPDYFSNITNRSFKQSTYAFFHRLNNFMSAFFGFIVCIVLIYMILWRTPKYFRHYSRMLLLSVISDLYFLFGNFWTQARLRISDGNMLFSMTGFAFFFSYQVQCHSTLLQSTSQALAYLILPIQYHYRYLSIKNKAPPTCLQITLYLLISVALAFLVGYNGAHALCAFENVEHVDFGRFWFEETSVPPLIVGSQTNPLMVWHTTIFTLISVLSYTVAFLYARLTVRELNKQSTSLSSRTRSLQQQFGKMLMAQSILPLSVTVFPTALSLILMTMNIGTGYMGEYIIQSISWFPFLNSLCALLFVAPYRQAFQKLVCPCIENKAESRINNSNSVAPNPNDSVNVSNFQSIQVLY